MPDCNYIKRKDKDFCVGDMDKLITIYSRNILPPDGESVDYQEAFSSPVTIWAMVETINGQTIFDDSNIERVVSHRFTTRFIPELTFEKWLDFGNNRYDILGVENQNERNQFMILKCNLRGLISLPVNEA